MFKGLFFFQVLILLLCESEAQAAKLVNGGIQLKSLEQDTLSAIITRHQNITSDSLDKSKYEMDFILSFGVSLNKPIIKTPVDGKPSSDHGYNISLMKHFLKKGIFILGLQAGWEHTNSSGEAYAKTPIGFRVVGAQGTIDDEKTCGCIFQKSTKYEFGLLLTVSLSKRFSLSPILSIGYFQLIQQAFHMSQTFEYNGANYRYNLLAQDRIKNYGYYPISKLRANIILTRNTAIWIEATSIKNFKITNDLVRFVPSGNADALGWYTFQQINSGAYKTTRQETRYDFVGLNIGFSFGLTNVKN